MASQTTQDSTGSTGTSTEELFTNSEIEHALEQFLEYGEQSYDPDMASGEQGHKGYFSGSGWAARCLRYHLKKLRAQHG
jgi:hypothetical protein